jgi:AmmeMemoRadiSam system protein B
VLKRSHIRSPAARGFYPGDCRAQLEAFIAGFHPPAEITGSILGAALPHAGWHYAGQVAARTLVCLRGSPPPETVVIFGTVHVGARQHALYPAGEWETPLGNLPVDESASAAIRETAGNLLAVDEYAHRYEHSIEVLAPMVKYFCPRTAIVPILVLPETTATDLGAAVAEAVSRLGAEIVFLASSDLTHYGHEYGLAPAEAGPDAQAWMRANDQRIIDILCHGTAAEVLEEALGHQNACGPGALAALKAAMQTRNAGEGILVEYATSYDVEPDQIFSRAVGYAGVVFPVA